MAILERMLVPGRRLALICIKGSARTRVIDTCAFKRFGPKPANLCMPAFDACGYGCAIQMSALNDHAKNDERVGLRGSNERFHSQEIKRSRHK
jgi:hypothetical protein